MRTLLSFLVTSSALTTQALAADSSIFGFEDGTLNGWSDTGSVSVLANDSLSLGGSIFELTAKGGFMAKISPTGSSVNRSGAETALGLSAGTFDNLGIPGINFSKNYGFITGSFTLDPGVYTFGWSYAAKDYQPYDDGVFFSIAGNGVNEVNVLAANVTGQTDTVIVGTYGSTPWQITSFTITSAGTYQLGFGGYNNSDTSKDPILFLDDGIGGLAQDGQIVAPSTPLTIDLGQESYLFSDVVSGAISPVFDGGVLAIGAEGEYALDFTINEDGGTLDAAGFDATLSGAFSGEGPLMKTGDGRLNLTGDNTLEGDVYVYEGELAINGSVSSFVRADGGVVGGTGLLGGLIVYNGGTAAPGNSIGILNVATDVTFESGSRFEVETNAAGASDQLIAEGSLIIEGGEVAVLAEAGDYAPLTTYTIAVADGGRTGEFDSATSNFAYLTPLLSYDDNSVFLTLARNDIEFSSTAETGNQAAVASEIDALGPENELWTGVAQLSAAAAPASFDTLSGEVHATIRTTLVEDARKAQLVILDRLFTDEKHTGAWTRILRSNGENDSDLNAASTDRETTGMLVGIDKPFGKVGIVGLAGGYSETQTNIDARMSEANIDAGHIFGYANSVKGPIRLGFSLGYNWSEVSTIRVAAAGPLSNTLQAEYNGSAFQANVSAAYSTSVKNVDLSPFANLTALRLSTDAFSEDGGAAALSSGLHTDEHLFSALGVRAQTNIWGPAQLRVSTAWQHVIGQSQPRVNLGFDDSSTFTLSGAPLSRNTALIETELSANVASWARLGASYVGQIGDRGHDHAMTANLVVSF